MNFSQIFGTLRFFIQKLFQTIPLWFYKIQIIRTVYFLGAELKICGSAIFSEIKNSL